MFGSSFFSRNVNTRKEFTVLALYSVYRTSDGAGIA
jgi:hypothetical protein